MLALSLGQCGTNYNDYYVDDDNDVFVNNEDNDGAVLKCHIGRNLFLTKWVDALSEMIII